MTGAPHSFPLLRRQFLDQHVRALVVGRVARLSRLGAEGRYGGCRRENKGKQQRCCTDRLLPVRPSQAVSPCTEVRKIATRLWYVSAQHCNGMIIRCNARYLYAR